MTVHDTTKVKDGLNFVVSGHGPEAVLMDMQGKVVHSWKAPWKAFYPKRSPQGRGAHRSAFWRAARLLPNGDLIVIFEGLGVGRIDKNSKVLWAAKNVNAHHESQVDANGDVWVLGRRARRIPRIHPKRPILEDFVVVLDGKTGVEKRRISILEAYEKSAFKDHFAKRRRSAGDVQHTNALEILDGQLAKKNPAFKKGNILLSMKNTDTAAVLDPNTGGRQMRRRRRRCPG